ncbi:MAG: hypothetical protein KAS64_03340 [Spirochaetes bacterium]|nr:hypothetical protein [Spirochaetota bacterium]
MRVNIIRIMIFFLTCLLPALSLNAEIIYLKNGDTIKGKIIYQDSKSIKVKARFTTLTIPKKKILRYEKEKPKKYESIINIYLKNGNALRGYFISQSKKIIAIRLMHGVILKIQKNNIERMDWKKKTTKKSINNQISKKNPWKSIWRSTVLPSWGQFYQGRNTKGWVFAASSFISISGLIFASIKYNNLRKEWDAGDNSISLWDNMSTWYNTRNVFTVAALTIWILNIIDAGIVESPTQNQKLIHLSIINKSSSQWAGIIFQKKF